MQEHKDTKIYTDSSCQIDVIPYVLLWWIVLRPALMCFVVFQALWPGAVLHKSADLGTPAPPYILRG